MDLPLRLELSERPCAQTVSLISQGLDAFNAQASGIDDRIPLAVTVLDANGTTLGGVTGRTSLGVLFLDVFFLPEALRGAGLGRRILAAAEAEAVRRGCHTGVLYTISFQAPGFYQRHGWRVFGEIPCDPPGTTRIFLRKTLRGG